MGERRGRGRKTWYECVKDDMKVLGLNAEWQCSWICGGASFQEEHLTLAKLEMDVLKINDDDVHHLDHPLFRLFQLDRHFDFVTPDLQGVSFHTHTWVMSG